MSMLRGLLKKLQEFLLPELATNGAGFTEPFGVLITVYQRISRLAQQIASHAEIAPYPHMADRLRIIAREEQEIANSLKKIIETGHEPLREGPLTATRGKNHWQRLIHDLEDQRDVDNILARYEFTLIPRVPQVGDLFQTIKNAHNRHRRSLQELIAVADPQASQT